MFLLIWIEIGIHKNGCLKSEEIKYWSIKYTNYQKTLMSMRQVLIKVIPIQWMNQVRKIAGGEEELRVEDC